MQVIPTAKKLFKIFNDEDNHHGFQYQDGLNIDTFKFNVNPYASNVRGGLHFADEKHICAFIHYGNYIREVEIPDDAKWIKDHRGITYRASALFLHSRKDLRDIDTWKWMIEQGIDIHAWNDVALGYSCGYGHIDVVKFLVERGANIKATNYYALKMASVHNRVDMVEYLLNEVGYSSYVINIAYEIAFRNCKVNMIKFLIQKGANIYVDSPYEYYDHEIHTYIQHQKYLDSKNIILRCCVFFGLYNIMYYIKHSKITKNRT